MSFKHAIANTIATMYHIRHIIIAIIAIILPGISDADAATCATTMTGVSNTHISNANYSTGQSGSTGYCTYTCENGYYFHTPSGVLTSHSVGVPSGVDTQYPTYTCERPKPKACSPNLSGYTTSNFSNSGSIQKKSDEYYYCVWTCKNGYSMEGAHSDQTNTTTHSVKATSNGGTMYPTSDCKPIRYKITFDCGAGATYGSTNAQTGTGYAAYNSSYTIPTTLCVKPQYSHTSWTGASSTLP